MCVCSAAADKVCISDVILKTEAHIGRVSTLYLFLNLFSKKCFYYILRGDRSHHMVSCGDKSMFKEVSVL